VELHDGTLPPERARAVHLHVDHCARCRDWVQAFAALDARLAADLPQPRLSANFDVRLHERLAALTRPVVRSDQSGILEREHDALLAALRRGARRNALLGAIGWATHDGVRAPHVAQPDPRSEWRPGYRDGRHRVFDGVRVVGVAVAIAGGSLWAVRAGTLLRAWPADPARCYLPAELTLVDGEIGASNRGGRG